jgi:membrane protein YdbS with pleckstrin-like domain
MKDKEVHMDLTQSHRLGKRAYLIFFTQHLKLVLLSFLIVLLVWYEQNNLPADYAVYVLQLSVILFIFVLALRLVRTTFEYLGRSYKFDDEFFQVTEGYITRNEIAMAYHQIQNVNIKRSMMDRSMGVSQIIVVMSGTNTKGEVDVVLPALDKHIARIIQKEIMRRSRRQFFKHTEEATPGAKPIVRQNMEPPPVLEED